MIGVGPRSPAGPEVSSPPLSHVPGILARGPWLPGRVTAAWSEHGYEPPAEMDAAADAGLAALAARGSPSHDGVAARLARFEQRDGELCLALQPMRWALRMVDG